MTKYLLFLLLGGLMACNSNPYGDTSGLGPNPTNKSQGGGVFSIQGPTALTVTEGQFVSALLVPNSNGENATLALQDPPAWATLDPSNGVFTCAPPAGTLMGGATTQTFPITVTLSTSTAPVVSISQVIMVTVQAAAAQPSSTGQEN